MSNRAIKFRAWNLAKGVYEPYQDMVNGPHICLHGHYRPVTKGEFYSVILEQFTGLIDAKGHEVYEGDILWDGNSTTCPFDGKPMPSDDYPYSWWERAVVRYDNELARFVLDFYSPYGGEGYSGRDQHIDEYIRKGDYVAGNIHENPELLNQS